MNNISKVAVALVGVAGLAMMAETAQAQTVVANGTGSSAGRLFAGQTPAFVCDFIAGQPPLYFKDTGNPPNQTEWQCKVSGVNHVFRYSATNSSDGFLKQPNGAVGTATFLNTAGCPAGTAFTIAGKAVLQSVCPAGTPTQTLPVHFGASDVKATSIHQTGNGASIAPPASGHLTTTPVVSVPFTLVVGGNVRGKDPVTGNPTTLLSITEGQARQILAGLVTDWTVLGLDTTTANKTIITCQRTVGSGTLATLDEAVMRTGFWGGGINPTASATNVFNPSSGNVKSCVENNPNAIGYIDSDTVPNLLLSAYQIGISGQAVNAGALGTGAARMKDLRCGRYIYWADWNVVTRNAGVEVAPVNAIAGTNLAIQKWIDQATLNNPLPDYWVSQNDMFVFKNDDRGPFNWFTPSGNGEDAATVCKKAGSTF